MNNNGTNNELRTSNNILFIALQRHKKGILIVILIAMLSTSFAWFYQSLKVAVKVDGEVDSWNVSVGEQGYYEFGFEDLYPGIEYTDADKFIEVKNKGNTNARLTLDVDSIYLYGEKLEKNKDYRIIPEYTYEDEEQTIIKSTKYTIKGFPFYLVVDLPQAIISSCEDGVDSNDCPTSRINFTLTWPYTGSLEPEAKSDEEGNDAFIPECEKNIMNEKVLQYVNDEKSRYEEINITVDDDKTHAYTDDRITTCDIIDTYYGEKSQEFKAFLKQDGLEFTKDGKFYITYDEETGKEIRHPVQSFYINLSLTVSQAGGHNIDIGK